MSFNAKAKFWKLFYVTTCTLWGNTEKIDSQRESLYQDGFSAAEFV